MGSSKRPILLLEEYTASREIAETQLERLRVIARDRLLTYEETKIYDVLAKNLSLAKGEATAISGAITKIDSVQDVEVEDLLQIAKQVTEQDVKKVLNFVEDDKDVESKPPPDQK